MEFVSSILGGSFTTCVVDPIRSRFRVACNLEDNYNELETARANLVAKRDDQQVKLEAEKRQDGVVASKETELWFSQVNKAVSDADNLKVENEKQRRGTCRNFFCWWPRYQLGKRVEKLKRHVEELYGDAEAKYGVIPVQEKGMKLTTVSIEGQSRTDTLKHQIIEAVLDDRYVVVGLHGMGGIGKTTLLQHVNNHFRGSEHFDSVIFTTLSATPDFVEIQKQIAKSLGLDLNQDDNYLQQKMSRLFQTSKFLLILDDMWERVPVIELSEIIFNIRLPNRDNGCKILMASRSPWVVTRFVTRFTGRDSLRTIQVNSLPRDEAWNLFVERVGNEITSKPKIKPLAEKVLRKCDGLPLAIIVIGGTMSGKKTEGEWRDAVRELEQPSTSNLNGIVEELFPKLMFSFEKLKPMDQSLFLYCCLFPEDDFIENESLVNFAIGEETLCDEMHKLGHMRDKVDALLGNLQNSSMLEEAFGRAFRMHDVMREFALWISKYIVKARARLTEAPDASEWPKATKISLMKNSEMKSLPQLPNSCPQLHTLLLNHCTHIKEIPQEHFLEHITALRVLDLSSTGIKNLPPSISHLVNLRMLRLRNCENLQALPPEIEMLVKLIWLDLNDCTSLRKLPAEIKNLHNLRRLDIYRTLKLKRIPRGVLSGLHKLEELENRLSGFKWYTNNNNIDQLEELSRLTRLTYIGETEIRKVKVSSSHWFKPLVKCMDELAFQNCTIDDPSAMPDFFLLLGEEDSIVRNKSVCFTSCEGLTRVPTRGCSCLTVRDCPDLKTLLIVDEEEEDEGEALRRRRNDNIAAGAAFESLLYLVLDRVYQFEKICSGVPHQPGCFSNLEWIVIKGCPNLKVVFTNGVTRLLNKLRWLYVYRCPQLVNIVSDEDLEEIDAAFPSLVEIRLCELPELTDVICQHHHNHQHLDLKWPSLSYAHVYLCPKLRRPPFGAQRADISLNDEEDSEITNDYLREKQAERDEEREKREKEEKDDDDDDDDDEEG